MGKWKDTDPASMAVRNQLKAQTKAMRERGGGDGVTMGGKPESVTPMRRPNDHGPFMPGQKPKPTGLGMNRPPKPMPKPTGLGMNRPPKPMPKPPPGGIGGGRPPGGRPPTLINKPKPKPKPKPPKPKSNNWPDIVKAYFPRGAGDYYKDGGLVRGGGKATKGRGKGKMV